MKCAKLKSIGDGVDIHQPIGTYGDDLIGKVNRVFPQLAGDQLAQD